MMDKLKMHSVNKVDENVAKIGELFPNCVTERKNENGEVIGYSDAEIVINYDVNGTAQTPSVVKLSDLTENGWEIGKRYTYNITLGYDLILVGATVEKWEENGINTPIS